MMARCPRCRRHFRTLEDEHDMHECPYCGYDGHDIRHHRHCEWDEREVCTCEELRAKDDAELEKRVVWATEHVNQVLALIARMRKMTGV
jgi:hypothetical protein